VTGLIRDGVADRFLRAGFFCGARRSQNRDRRRGVGRRAAARGRCDKTGAKLGKLSWASQGVFQITPAHSTEISGEGMYDTSSIEKTVRAVVTLSFGLD
jgi:hypothetical protein